MIRIALGIAVLGLGACSKQPVSAPPSATTSKPAITSAEPASTAPAKPTDEPENEATGAGQADELAIDCDAPGEEAVHLQEAPPGAVRTSEHTLVVKWVGGESEFIDEPPFDDPGDEPLSGVAYRYCGYSSSLGMHLVSKVDHGYFTGVLLDHRTGKRLEGGSHVSFSPDQRRYFSSSQADGTEGEDWVVRSRDGEILWEGSSSNTAMTQTLHKNCEGIIGELDQPRWSESGDLEATLQYSIGRNGEKQFTVVLSKQQPQWRWLPKIDCPESDR